MIFPKVLHQMSRDEFANLAGLKGQTKGISYYINPRQGPPVNVDITIQRLFACPQVHPYITLHLSQ